MVEQLYPFELFFIVETPGIPRCSDQSKELLDKFFNAELIKKNVLIVGGIC